MVNLKVGQEVFIHEISSNIPPVKGIINKVGKKYFYVECNRYRRNDMQFEISTLKYYVPGYSSRIKCWLSMSEYNDNIELIKLRHRIPHLINHSLTLEQLQRIQAIINE